MKIKSFFLCALLISVFIYKATSQCETYDQILKVVAADRQSGDRFGYSIDMLRDIAIVGAYLEDEDSMGQNTMADAGAAYIFRNVGNSWNLEAKLVAPDRSAGDHFGFSVSLAYNLESFLFFAFVGAPGKDLSAGSVYVFSHFTSWTQGLRIDAPDRSAGDQFGFCVDANPDVEALGAHDLLIGAPFEDEDETDSNTLVDAGSVYLIKGLNPSSITKIVAPDRQAGDLFGSSISAPSFETMFIGAPGEDEDAEGLNTMPGAGSVYMSTWIIQPPYTNSYTLLKLVASDRSPGASFGSSIDSEEEVTVIGAPYEDQDAAGSNPLNDAGAVYVFEGQELSMRETQKITASDRDAGDLFGYSLAVHKEIILIGSAFEDHDVAGGSALTSSGSAYIYGRDMNWGWIETKKVTAPVRAASDQFGSAVSLHNDYALIGAALEDDDAMEMNFLPDAGSVYFFRDTFSRISLHSVKMPPQCDDGSISLTASGHPPYSYQWSNGATSSSITGLRQGVYTATATDGCGFSTRYFTYLDANITEIEKIIAVDREAGAEFGWKIDISGKYAVVGAPFEDKDADGSNALLDAGAAYVLKNVAGDKWVHVQKLTASDRSPLDYFGNDVAISGDYIAVAARLEDEDAAGANTLNNAGSVYIFKKDAFGNWDQHQKVVASDRDIGDEFGGSLSMSANRLAVGAWFEDHDPVGANFVFDAGSAYIFEKNPSGFWVEAEKVVASDRSASDLFSFSVSIIEDRLIAGAVWEDEDIYGSNTLSMAGSAYIFNRNSFGQWNETQKLTALNRNLNGGFGFAVSMDSVTVAVGEPFISGGKLHIFKEAIDGNWYELRVYSEIQNGSEFGSSISVSGDHIAVGALKSLGGSNQVLGGGSVRVLSNFDFTETILASDRGVNDYFGGSVAMDGRTLMVGAILEDHDENGNDSLESAGSIYLYTLDCVCQPPTQQVATPSFKKAQLNWNSVDDAQSYIVEGGALGSGYIQVPIQNNSLLATGLTWGTSYEWHISSVCENGDTSWYSDLDTFSTLSCESPTGLSSQPTFTKALLTWNSADNALGYELKGGLQGGPYLNLTQISTSINATGLTQGTTYEWRVRSLCSSSVYSNYSNWETFTTQNCHPPAGLQVSNVTSTSATLGWGNVPDAIGYRLVGGTGATPQVTLDLSNNSYNAGGLSPGTTYNWAVYSICGYTSPFLSAVSAINTFTTPSATAKTGTSDLISLQVIPNPNSGIFQIRVEHAAADFELKIFNAGGREIWQSRSEGDKEMIIDFKEFAGGFYLIKLLSGEEIVIEKMVIN
ncbi:MAG: T9SS type A sorting domain-containing protein [Chitinophagales bacterium]|nr:T9SS type A sorting domain-containing protein [Chitinophagales bacterium]